MEAFQWLLTPGAVFAVLVLVVPLYEPTVRWQRRLKGDIAIAGGLPAGFEKEQLEKSIVVLAKRLRLYRQAMTPMRTIVKLISLAYIGTTLTLVLLFPPINTPETKIPFGPADYWMMAAGTFQMVLVLSWIASGRDWGGRTPEQVIALDRVKRFHKRGKAIKRIDKVRADLIKEGGTVKASSSKLGFETQVDVLAKYVRNSEIREVVTFTHFAGAGLSDASQRAIRERGELIPPELLR